MEVGLGPGHIVRWGSRSLPKGEQPPILAHVCCGQMSGWIKMSLGREIGLSPDDIVLDGTQLPSPKRGTAAPPHFAAHVYCGKTARWIKMPLDMEVSIGPGHIVLDGDRAHPPKKQHNPQIFGPCLLWPKGWMDKDATWYGGRPRSRERSVQ